MRTKCTIIKTPRHFYLFVEVFMNQWPSVKKLINIKGGEWLLCGECGSQNKHKITWERVTSDMLFFNMIKTEREN
jgi:hypothetical protein